jgi:hypothetical protein
MSTFDELVQELFTEHETWFDVLSRAFRLDNGQVGSVVYYERILLHASNIIDSKLHGRPLDPMDEGVKVRRNNQYMVNACNFLYNLIYEMTYDASGGNIEVTTGWRSLKKDNQWSLAMIDVLHANMRRLIGIFHKDFLFWMHRKKEQELTVQKHGFSIVTNTDDDEYAAIRRHYETNLSAENHAQAVVRVKFMRALLYEMDHLQLYGYLAQQITDNTYARYQMRELLDFFNGKLCKRFYGDNEYRVQQCNLQTQLRHEQYDQVINEHVRMIWRLDYNAVTPVQITQEPRPWTLNTYHRLQLAAFAEILPFDQQYNTLACHKQCVEYVTFNASGYTLKMRSYYKHQCEFLVLFWVKNDERVIFDLISYDCPTMDVSFMCWSERLKLLHALHPSLPIKSFVQPQMVPVQYVNNARWIVDYIGINTEFFIRTAQLGVGTLFKKTSSMAPPKTQRRPLSDLTSQTTEVNSRSIRKRYPKVRNCDLYNRDATLLASVSIKRSRKDTSSVAAVTSTVITEPTVVESTTIESF